RQRRHRLQRRPRPAGSGRGGSHTLRVGHDRSDRPPALVRPGGDAPARDVGSRAASLPPKLLLAGPGTFWLASVSNSYEDLFEWRWTVIRRSLLTLALFLTALPLAAGPIPKDRIPSPLQPWTDWVMRGHETEVCPFLLGADDPATASRQCAWPGRLVLDLGEKEGRFSQDWNLQVSGYVPLPGEEAHWPLELTVDGRPAAAVANDGAPGLWLPAGRHTLAGVFRWDSLPESLDLSQEAGLVALKVRGAAVPFPDRDADGRIFLQRTSTAQTEAESLQAIVHRRVVDTVPLVLVTRI